MTTMTSDECCTRARKRSSLLRSDASTFSLAAVIQPSISDMVTAPSAHNTARPCPSGCGNCDGAQCSAIASSPPITVRTIHGTVSRAAREPYTRTCSAALNTKPIANTAPQPVTYTVTPVITTMKPVRTNTCHDGPPGGSTNVMMLVEICVTASAPSTNHNGTRARNP